MHILKSSWDEIEWFKIVWSCYCSSWANPDRFWTSLLISHLLCSCDSVALFYCTIPKLWIPFMGLVLISCWSALLRSKSKHNTQNKTSFSYNEMLRLLSLLGSSLASNKYDQTLSSKSLCVGGLTVSDKTLSMFCDSAKILE